MHKRVLSVVILVLCACMVVPLGLAQGDAPTVAILRFGDHLGPLVNRTEYGLLHALQGLGFFSGDDMPALEQRQDMMFERVNIIWGDAGYDFNNAAQMVEAALDQGADAMLTISTPVTQLALNATLDMEDPPGIIFAAVFNPKEAGIIQSSCIKPPHVTGFVALSPYEEILQIMLTQAPDIEVIGTIFNRAEASGVAGAAEIVAVGEARGLRVEQASVTGMADLRTATQGLINKGAQLIVLPADLTTLGGFPAILAVANDNGVPVFHAHINAVEVGATLTAGFDLFYIHGVIAGVLLAEYLGGDLDIAITAVRDDANLLGVGLNMDSAAELGIDFKPEVLEMAGRKVQDGDLTVDMAVEMGGLQVVFANVAAAADEQQSAQLRKAMQAFLTSESTMEDGVVRPSITQILASLLGTPFGSYLLERSLESVVQCSPEMIAEQQAALDAMEG